MARKNKDDTPDPLHGGTIHVPRSRGAVSGILLIALGAWGALIPFIGPWFNFSYTPDQSWHWTAARWWLEVLPGIAVFVGGLVLLLSANRITASIGGWVAVAGGVWFVLGTTFESLFHLGSPGTPAGSSETLRVIESLALFGGLGALIIILATLALGRLSVRSVRDVRSAQRREVEQELELRRRADYARAREAELAAGGSGPDDADGRGEGGSTPTQRDDMMTGGMLHWRGHGDDLPSSQRPTDRPADTNTATTDPAATPGYNPSPPNSPQSRNASPGSPKSPRRQ